MEKPHRRLDAWNSSVDLVMAIYQMTERSEKRSDSLSSVKCVGQPQAFHAISPKVRHGRRRRNSQTISTSLKVLLMNWILT